MGGAMSSPEKTQLRTLPLPDRQHQNLGSSNSASQHQRSTYDSESIRSLPPHFQTNTNFPVSPFETNFSVPLSPSFPVGPIEPGIYQNETPGQELDRDTVELHRDLGLDFDPNQYGAPTYHAASYNNPTEPNFYPELDRDTVELHRDLGLDLDFNQYGAPMYHPASNDLFNYPVQPNLDPSPPLTSAASSQDAESSKRTSTSTAAPSRRSAKEKRRKEKKGNETSGRVTKRAKAKKPRARHLEAPLSELTNKYEHIPIKDMLAWINRPSEERQEERFKRGAVPRPMNCYMIYRIAYTDRCIVWCGSRNSQMVSKVCGESWAYETPAIKALYRQYSAIEKAKHAIAFPGYRYAPAPARRPSRHVKESQGEAWEKTMTARDELKNMSSELDDEDRRLGLLLREYLNSEEK